MVLDLGSNVRKTPKLSDAQPQHFGHLGGGSITIIGAQTPNSSRVKAADTMRSIEEIQRQLAQGEFEFSRHAFRRAVERNISEAEIRQAGATAQLVEDYPTDKYSPSCLLLGLTDAGRVLHLQVSRAETKLTKIVTLYEPSPHD